MKGRWPKAEVVAMDSSEEAVAWDDPDLGIAWPVRERHDRAPGPLDFLRQLRQLPLRDQQFALAARLVLKKAPGLSVFGNIGVDQIEPIVLERRIALRDVGLPFAQRLHLGAGQHDAGFHHVLDIIFKARPPVFGDRLHLHANGRLGPRHQIRPAWTSAASTAAFAHS